MIFFLRQFRQDISLQRDRGISQNIFYFSLKNIAYIYEEEKNRQNYHGKILTPTNSTDQLNDNHQSGMEFDKDCATTRLQFKNQVQTEVMSLNRKRSKTIIFY